MSIRITKAGIFDTIQDAGRPGYRSCGINPGGAMDFFAAGIANALMGNTLNTPVIECHFPAACLQFERDTMLAITGADFSPAIDGVPVPLFQPVIAAAGSVLEHKALKNGARTYIAFREKLDLPVWLNSYSTNTKLSAGGWRGRLLQKNDCLPLSENNEYTAFFDKGSPVVLPWRANVRWHAQSYGDTIYLLAGPEYHRLNEQCRRLLEEQPFTISTVADRMGYQLQETLPCQLEGEMLSSATTFGTLQLLPGGRMIVLMADHQVSGGYPRIAHVITAHLPLLAQQKPGDTFRCRMIDQHLAEELLLAQRQHVLLLQHACRFKLEELSRGVRTHPG